MLSKFWYRERGGRFSIGIAPTKLDFSVHAVSAFICRQRHGRPKKLDHLPQSLGALQISLRDSFAPGVKKE